MIKRKSKMQSAESRWGKIFILPVMIQFLVFFLLPLAFCIYAAFTNWNIVKGTQDFIWFDNFTKLFSDGKFWKAIGNTFYMLIPIPIYLILAMLFSLACHKGVPGNKAFRVIYYLPYVSSIVALVIMWKWLFNYEYGLVNGLLSFLNISGPNWLGDPEWIKRTIVIMISWKMIGVSSIYLLASLKNIPESYYEAAKIDGATSIQSFFKITLPLMSPTLFYLSVVGIIGSLQTFVEVQLFTTDGGRNYSAGTMVYYIWQKAFDSSQMGFASSAAVLFGLLILGITIIQFKVSNKWV